MRITYSSVVLILLVTLYSSFFTVQGQTPASLPPVYSSGVKVNYIRTFEATAPISNPLEMLTRPLKDVKQTTQYLDGLGRQIQTVVKQGSLVTGQTPTDFVSANVFDAFGREVYQYLPFSSNGDDGTFKLDPFQQQTTFYNSQLLGQSGETEIGANHLNWAYGKTIYEPSPLNRVQAQFAPGASWVGSEGSGTERKVHTQYWTNTSTDSVRIWIVTDAEGDFGTYGSALTYSSGELYKNVQIDEHGKQSIEYKDKKGLVVLKKIQLTASADPGSGSGYTGWICTYYIYDDFNLLRAVIQPRGVEILNSSSWVITTDLLNHQCFRYAYDGRQRIVQKQVPGAGVVYLIYDQWDRLVLTQDANQRPYKKWLFTKYDALNRQVMTGLYTHSVVLAQDTMQRFLTAQNKARFETRNATLPGYTLNLSFPVVTAPMVYTATYYDDYSWASMFSGHGANYGSFDNSFTAKFATPSNTSYPYPQTLAQRMSTRGMVTGTYDSCSNGLVTSLLYDERGRVIQTKERNAMGGNDITTTQYDFSGKPLQRLYQQAIPGTAAQTHRVWTTYSYDDLGRVLIVRKAVDSKLTGITDTIKAPEVIIAANRYDALGQLKTKDLGQQQEFSGVRIADPVETLRYAYNVRGWLLGMNRSEMLTANGNSGASAYFGFELGYDKLANNSNRNYQQGQYNGNISGMTWKSSSDGLRRKYDFTYDAANRLLQGLFEQNDAGSTWGQSKVDFTSRMGNGIDPNTGYDANGNLKKLSHMGLTFSGPQKIDSLTYSYFTGGDNKLQNVADAITADYGLGDFIDRSTGNDYGYDPNGNLVTDRNKDLYGATGRNLSSGGAISYNHLNLPVGITVQDASSVVKGTISYSYDHIGTKLNKTVVDKTVSGKTITTTTSYVGGMVYESKSTSPVDANNPDYTNRLQLISHEEGRVRFIPGGGTAPAKYQYDYFINDHLDNVRMVLTEQEQLDIYPIASLEGDPNDAGSAIAVNHLFYQIDPALIVPSSSLTNFPVYENNNGIPTRVSSTDSAQLSQQVYRLQSGAIGLGMTLKVMGGDKVSLFGKAIYRKPRSAFPENISIPALAVLEGLLGPGSVAANKGATAIQLNGVHEITNALSTFLDNSGRYDPSPLPLAGFPKAALNWILFDEQFKVVESCMGFKPLTTYGIDMEDLSTLGIEMTKSGYLYVFCSNENTAPVYFDNIQVIHERGRILEETHYYPFGLTMKGISGKSAGGLENKKRYNGNELQSQEFSDGSGLEVYDFNARTYDQQIGRFIQVDPESEQWQEGWTPYHFGFNNPILNNDPDGKFPIVPIVRGIVQGYRAYRGIRAVQKVAELANQTALANSATVNGLTKTYYNADGTSGTFAGLADFNTYLKGNATIDLVLPDDAKSGNNIDLPYEAKGGTYVLRDPLTGVVERTGRTNDLERRKKEHAKGYETGGLEFQIDLKTDDKDVKRGREQQIYEKYKARLDKIKPIADENKNKQKYLDAIDKFIKDLEESQRQNNEKLDKKKKNEK